MSIERGKSVFLLALEFNEQIQAARASRKAEGLPTVAEPGIGSRVTPVIGDIYASPLSEAVRREADSRPSLAAFRRQLNPAKGV